MWSYLRQNHPKKADELAAQVIEEARALYEQGDAAWNTQVLLLLLLLLLLLQLIL
jgi:hypothetical protein